MDPHTEPLGQRPSSEACPAMGTAMGTEAEWGLVGFPTDFTSKVCQGQVQFIQLSRSCGQQG